MTVFGLLVKADNINLSDLARKLNVTPQVVNSWTKGRKIPKKRISEIANILNVPEEFILMHNIGKITLPEKILIYKRMIENDLGVEVEISIKN